MEKKIRTIFFCINLIVLSHVIHSTDYAGDYGFEISFSQPSKETKSTTWTVSCNFEIIDCCQGHLYKRYSKEMSLISN